MKPLELRKKQKHNSLLTLAAPLDRNEYFAPCVLRCVFLPSFLFVQAELWSFRILVFFPVSPIFSPSSSDLSGCPEDSPDAAAWGEGLHQLLVLWDQADCLRGLRLPQREAFSVPGRHWIHLPDQQQCLPLGLIHANINKIHRYPERKTGKNRQMYTYRLPLGLIHSKHYIQRLPELMEI